MTAPRPTSQLVLDLFSGTEPQLREALEVREAVFIREQGIDPDIEIDEFDAICWHAIAYLDGEPVGTARLILEDRFTARIGRVSVLAEARGVGVGKALMRLVEDYARREGITRIVLDAQVQVIPFYEQLAYTAVGEVFVDAGILHRRMQRNL